MNNSGTNANRPAVRRPAPPQRVASTDTTIKPVARSTTTNNGQPRPVPSQSTTVPRPQPQRQQSQGQPQGQRPQDSQALGQQPQQPQANQQSGPPRELIQQYLAQGLPLQSATVLATARAARDAATNSNQEVPLARTPIPADLLPDLAHALNETLGPVMPFAFIRGLALRYLGASPAKRPQGQGFPPSHEVEILVAGPSVRALKVLAEKGGEQGWFGSWVDPAGPRVVYYRGMDGLRYKVVAWAPSQVRMPFTVGRTPAPPGAPPSAKGFDGPGPVVRAGLGQARVLKPGLLLDAACDMWMAHQWREDTEGMRMEGGNMAFLLGYMAAKKMVVSQGEMGEMEHAMDGEFREELGKFEPGKKGKWEAMFAAVGLKERK